MPPQPEEGGAYRQQSPETYGKAECRRRAEAGTPGERGSDAMRQRWVRVICGAAAAVISVHQPPRPEHPLVPGGREHLQRHQGEVGIAAEEGAEDWNTKQR